MLNTRVLALGVLTDEDGVNVVIWGFVAGNGFARADVGEKVEGTAEGKVERDMAFADRGLGDDQLRDLLVELAVIRPRVLLERQSSS